MNTYQEVVEYLYQLLPSYQRTGDSTAIKKSLDNTLRLLQYLDNPHQNFSSVHIAGTNGKGSVSHYFASIYQEAGYKTGLYTSPHLKDFRERMRVNGVMISEAKVIDFVHDMQDVIREVKPSFFELTVAMAFHHFSQQKVDVAIVEVGMGGRLDSTNVISPLLSVITNIGWDHMEHLGDTLPKIAGEKAGIIKENTPVVVSEYQQKVYTVFEEKAREKNANLFMAQELIELHKDQDKFIWASDQKWEFTSQMLGSYQYYNIRAVLAGVTVLREKLPVDSLDVINGIEKAVRNTGLKGRWQRISERPQIICDVAHNEPGVRACIKHLQTLNFDRLWIIWGMVKGKDTKKILELLPFDADFIFTQPHLPRALDAHELARIAAETGRKGNIADNVNEAIAIAKERANENDLIFISGSNFLIAEINEL